MMLSPRVRGTAPGLEQKTASSWLARHHKSSRRLMSPRRRVKTIAPGPAQWLGPAAASHRSRRVAEGLPSKRRPSACTTATQARSVRYDAVLLASSWSWSTASTATMARPQRLTTRRLHNIDDNQMEEFE